MSGFLHRLAAQAIGQARPVRSMARLPYRELPPAEAAEEGELPTDVLQSAGSRPDTIALIAAGKKNRATNDQLPAGLSAASAAAPLSDGAVERSVETAPPALVRPVHSRTVSDIPLETAQVVAALLADTPLHQRAHRQETEAPTGLVSPKRLLRTVAPLIRQSPAAAAPVKFEQPATHEQHTDVHVSIGRIEVTAVQEAAPPRRAAPRGPKPMSLEEYLTRRSGAAR